MKQDVWSHVVILVLFLVINTVLNAYNKYLFTSLEGGGAGFHVPLLVTATHAIAGSFVAAFLALWPSIFTPKKIELGDWKQWGCVFGISVFFVASIGMNNMSLKYLNLSLQQVIRSAGPAVVAMFSYLIEKRRFEWKQMLSLLVLVGGVIMSVAGGDMSGYHVQGIILCIASVGASGLQYVFVSLCMDDSRRLKSLDLLLYTGPPVVLIMVPSMLFEDEPSELADFVEMYGQQLAFYYIILGCFLAVCYNMIVYTFVSMMGPVYISVVGVFKVILIIMFSVLFFGEQISVTNAVGLFVAGLGFCTNTYFELTASQHDHGGAADPLIDDKK